MIPGQPLPQVEAPRRVCGCCDRSTFACTGCGKLFLRDKRGLDTRAFERCCECWPAGWGIVADPFALPRTITLDGETFEIPWDHLGDFRQTRCIGCGEHKSNQFWQYRGGDRWECSGCAFEPVRME